MILFPWVISTMNQGTLQVHVMAWLQDRGFRVMVTGGRKHFVISVSDLFAGGFKVPDLAGFGVNGQVVLVEVETDKQRFFDALGKCMLWRCMATFVYLAFPKGRIERAPFLQKVGIGLLEVDEESDSVTELVPLPAPENDLRSVWELHPTDFTREQRLADLIRNTLT